MAQLSLRRVVGAGGWALGTKGSQRLLALGRTVILARLLSPEDFGLYAVVMVTFAIVHNITDVGLKAAIVQRESLEHGHYSTAWTSIIIRNGLLCVGLYGLAPAIAGWFGEPKSTVLFRWFAISVAVDGFTNVYAFDFERYLKFEKEFFLVIAEALSDFVVAVGVAFIWRSPVAFVVGVLAGKMARLITSYIVAEGVPSLLLDVTRFRELFSFGGWMWAIGLVGAISMQIDRILVGKLLGAAALGMYTVGSRAADIVPVDFGRVVATVGFPGYSRLERSSRKQRVGLLLGIQAVGLVAIPVSLVLAIHPREILRVAVGTKWLDAAPILRILGVAGFVRGLLIPISVLLRGVGTPRWDFYMTAVRGAGLAVLGIPAALYYGASGVALSYLLAVLMSVPLAESALRSSCRFSLTSVLSDLGDLFLAGFLTAMFVVGVPILAGGSTVATIISSCLTPVLFIGLVYGFGRGAQGTASYLVVTGLSLVKNRFIY